MHAYLRRCVSQSFFVEPDLSLSSLSLTSRMSLETDESSVAIAYSLCASFPDLAIGSTPPSLPTPAPAGAPGAEAVVAPEDQEKKAERKYELQESVDYGAVAANLSGHGSEKYYLTTAIAYTNGYPHIGHAYEV